MFDDLYRDFSFSERALLAEATADEVMEPPDTLGSKLPQSLRAKFMALVVQRMPAAPWQPLSIYTDPS